MYATLSLDLERGRLTCEGVGFPAHVQVVYRLMRHGTVIDEVSLAGKSAYEWDLKALPSGGGDYHVAAVVGDQTFASEWQFVPGIAVLEEYRAWLDTPQDVLTFSLPTPPRANKPFESIAVISTSHAWRANVEDWDSCVLKDYCRPFTMVNDSGRVEVAESPTTDPGWLKPSTTVAVSSVPPLRLNTDGDSFWAFGSGFAFDQGRLLRGSEVARGLSPRFVGRAGTQNPADSTRAMFTSCKSGDFAAALWRPDGSVEFHSDYFGASAWFVYRGEGLRIVASTYLLAVEVARACGEELSLNLQTVDADFTSLTQPFQQPLLDDLELNNFSCLPPDSNLVVLAEGEDRVGKSQMGHDLTYPDRFTLARYEELLRSAEAELVDNCRALLEDPQIESIRCDITGGLDSRLVLAGFLANSDVIGDKVTLHTEAVANAPSAEDEEIATLIAAATGLAFSRRGETMIGPCSPSHVAQTQLAATFGTYWHRGHGHAVQWDSSVAFSSGAGLDDVARDYTTKGWKLTSSPVQAPEEVSIDLARQVFKWRGKATLKATPTSGIRELARAWDSLPGNQAEKASQLFNFHRARFHGGGAIPAALGAWRVTPGRSRSLYQLRLMAGSVVDGPQVQLELVHRLNPGLAAVPYGNTAYNLAYSAGYGEARTDLVGDHGDLRSARQARQANRQWASCAICDTHESNSSDRRGASREIALQALHELGRDPLLRDLLVSSYRFATNDLGKTFGLDHSFSITFINKVLHLHAMWRMTQVGSEGEH